MKTSQLVRALAAITLLAACGALNADVKLGSGEGIPKVDGSNTVDIPQDFVCGNDIPAGQFTVKTAAGTAANTCVFTFHNDVTVIKVADYSGPNGATLK